MQRRRVPLLLRIFIVCTHLSSAFQKSEGKHEKGNNVVGTQRRHQAYDHVVYGKRFVIEMGNVTKRGQKRKANKKRYVIEVQDRQQAVKLANPIVDLEDSVRRGINDPLSDPRFIMNRINDDFFSSQTGGHSQPHSRELMNYQNRDRFSSTILGGNTHMLRPLTAGRPQQQNAIKEQVVARHLPMQGMPMRPIPRHAFTQFSDFGMTIQNSQQLPGLGMQMQLPRQQVQTLQRQPVSQLSNVALGGQLSSGMPAFNVPRQPSEIGSISIFKQPAAELPVINLPQRMSNVIPGLSLPGQQSNNLLTSSTLQHGSPQVLDFSLPSQAAQQEMAQQQGIALETNIPAQLRGLTIPQQQQSSSALPMQPPNHQSPLSIQPPNNPSSLTMHSPNHQSVAEVEHNIQGDIRTPETVDMQPSEADKLEIELRAIQRSREHDNMNMVSHSKGNQARQTSNSMKTHRKMLGAPHRFESHRFIDQNQMPSQKRANSHTNNLKGRRVRVRPRFRPTQQRLKKHRERDMEGIDELTGLPADLELNNGATGVSSITAVSDPAPQPTSVTVDTGEEATQIGDASSKERKAPEIKSKSDGGHDSNSGTRDLLSSIEGNTGDENLSSIKEFLEADALLRDKLNKDSAGSDDTSQKNNELGNSDLSNEKPINIGGDGENYEVDKSTESTGNKKRSLIVTR